MNSQGISFSRLPGALRSSLLSARRPAPTPDPESTVSLSAEARRRLSMEAGTASPGELLSAMQAAVKANADQLAAARRAARDPGKRIQEAKDKLKQLMERLQRAALMGDRRAIAAIAKEIAGVARDVAGAFKDAAAEAKLAASGGGGGILAESLEGSGASESADGTAGSDPTAEGGEALGSGELPHLSGLDEGLVREGDRAMLLVRSLLSMARAALDSRSPRKRDSREDEERKILDRAEAEVEKATEEIRDAIRQAAA